MRTEAATTARQTAAQLLHAGLNAQELAAAMGIHRNQALRHVRRLRKSTRGTS